MDWQGLPYYPINQFYKSFFGEKVYKIPVSVATSCPNREGIGGMKPCIFCDEWGSAAYPEYQQDDLSLQIEKNKITVKKRAHAKKFLVYFQAYTNSFLKTSQLRKAFEVALEDSEVCGFVVGTRPDCLSHGSLQLWEEFSQKTSVFVELGVQSFREDRLKWLERGHSGESSKKAVFRIREACPEVNVGIHLILGLPNETEEEIIEAAQISSQLAVDNVKLHNLHVLKNTPLEDLYHKGEFTPLEFEEYAQRAMIFLQHLSPQIAVHRIVATASRREDLVGSDWLLFKMKNYQSMIDYLKTRKAYQGEKFFKEKNLDATESGIF